MFLFWKPLCMSAASCMALAACDAGIPGSNTPSQDSADLVVGPPVEAISTPFDDALSCLGGKVSDDLTFSVGNVTDATGKEQYSDGGSGKFITQGSGDMLQSALFGAGVTVLNRRDPSVPLAEVNWGIRDISTQLSSDFYITGSINSLDFIPGGGTQIGVAGVGPRWRQSRILVGIDLAMTSAHDGRIVANSAIQKQLYAKEIGFSVGRFLNDTLVIAETGGSEREALHHTLRQVLNYATFDLLAQVAKREDAATCFELVAASGRVLQEDGPPRFGDGRVFERALSAAREAKAADVVEQAPVITSADILLEARQLGNAATSHAARAIAAADSVLTAETAEVAGAAADDALQAMTLAIQTLRAAAAKGLAGPEGDAAATLVEKAIVSAQAAQQMATEKAIAEDVPAQADVLIDPTATGDAVPQDPPISPEDKRLGGAGR